MGKKIKTGKARKDRFYFLAKETGFRSRAAFKLIQLNRRFNFLNTSRVLVDLCAAPGGWLQVASKEMPVSSQIIGVDLVPIQPIPRVKTFVADITTDKCRQLIRQELLQTKADVVLHDGAPNVGTAWSIDEYSQANLCLQAFSLATEILRKGGWFVTKVFRSRDYEPLKWVLSQFFRTVRAIKPEASRLESAEIFLIGQFYRAPDRIDQKFLDARHVFGEIEQPKDRATVVSVLLKENRKKKKAEGYAEGDNLYHELKVSEFLKSPDPLEALARTNKIVFDLPDIADHPLTTPTVKSDVEDIQVLGKADIKNILKWRKKILQTLEETKNPPEAVEARADKTPTDEADKEASDLDVEEEVQRLVHEEEKQKKKRLKRVRKAKIKLAERLVLKMEHPGDRIEQHDDELFSLATLHDLIGLEEANRLVGDTSLTGVDELVRREKAAAIRALREKREEERRSAIEGAKRVHFERRGPEAEEREFEEDQVHGQRDDVYLSSDTGSSEDEIDSVDLDRSRKTSRSIGSVESSEDEEDAEETALAPPTKRKRVEGNKDEDSKLQAPIPRLDAFTLSRMKRNPLLVDLDDAAEETKEKRKIRSWLESDEIQNLLNPVEDDGFSAESDYDAESPEAAKGKRAKQKQGKRDARETDKIKEAKSKTDPNNDDTEPGNKDKKKKKNKKQNDSTATARSDNTGAGDQPLEKTGDNTELKSVQRLKRLRRPLTPVERALALRLVRSAKSRRDLIESQYHRMQFFEDPSELPDWFVEDEKKHMRKPLPLTKEEIVEDRPTMGRSISKVEEAKARKKARLAKRLKRIRRKVEGISDEVSEAEKWQQIKQMYKKAGLLTKKRRPLHVIVNSKAGARNSSGKIPKGAKVKIVDRRMKADLRGQQRGRGGSKTTKRRGGMGPRGKGRSTRPVKLMAHKPRNGGRRR